MSPTSRIDPFRQDQGEEKFSIWEHLEELRLRLIRSILGLGAGIALSLLFSSRILNFLLYPTRQLDLKLALLSPPEGFLVHLKISLVAGTFLTSPWWLGQLWAFIKPGLYPQERKVSSLIIGISSLSFLLGGMFGYLVLPYATRYFASFASSTIEPLWSLDSYITFSLQFLLAFAITFELPLALYALSLLGVVRPEHLRRYRRHAIVGILIIAGVITPPDIFSQVLVAVPLIILYEVGIWASYWAWRGKS